jgi:hypothetical protein
MLIADLVLLQQGRPVVVVEAKGRSVPADFRHAALEQLRVFAERTSSQWALLVDPDFALIYSTGRMDVPLAKIPTSEVIESAGLAMVENVGESILLIAVDRWLRSLPKSARLPERYPELSDFVSALRDVDESVREFALD